ncbi:MAG: peptidylprolyl isomerase [Hyphomicrobiales bacterium]|nr:peptidylprolyl isomerase [Hyphomicrobiales bacterium]MDE2114977.1 peptidylprolyl isomerase [Hyphomicrobiales bacterium]
MSCTPHTVAPSRKVVSVNGHVIAREAISREAQHHPADKPSASWSEAAMALVIRELLLQEADRLEIATLPRSDAEGRCETDDEARMRALIEQAAAVPVPNEAECRRYFEQNRRRFRTPDLFEVRHILLASDPRDTTRLEAASALAATLSATLAADPGKFADIARAHSDCPSAAQGGNLGQIGKGQTVPEFESVLARLPVGEITKEPIQSRYGLHIVQVERRIEGRELPFEAVSQKIATYLADGVERRALSQFVSVLAGRAKIVGVSLPGATAPLLQ